VAPAKGGADRHATPLGRGDHRLAFAQRPAEVEPALLLPQPGQRRAGQRVEAPAASLAPEPPQSVGLAAADRRPVAAVRAAPFVTRARLDHRRYRRARRLSGQHLFKLQALVDGQVVHLRKPRPKDAVFHYKLHQYAMDSTMGSRTDLTRIVPCPILIRVAGRAYGCRVRRRTPGRDRDDARHRSLCRRTRCGSAP